MLSLQQLRTAITESEALEYALGVLRDLGFNATSWQSGSKQLTLVKLFSNTYSALTLSVKALAEAGLNEYSTGDALTALSLSHFRNTRQAATRATHLLRLTAAAGAGPHTIVIGQQVFQETESGDGLLFTVSALPNGATLSPASTLDIHVQAQAAGTAGNVSIGTITVQQTPLAGVTVTNPDNGDGTSLVTSGTDEESDEALRERNRNRWGELSWATPALGYAYFAQRATSNVARVKVDQGNPRGPGTVDVYIAGASGASASGDVTLVQTELDRYHAGTPDPLAIAAPATAVDFTANVYVSSQHFTSGTINANKATEIEDALAAYVNGLPIGGRILPMPDGDGTTGYLLASEWRAAVTSVDGVEGLGSTSPASDTAVASYGIATVGTVAFTYIPISV